METVYLTKNEFKALKLHWAGGHHPSKIAEKCKITLKRYNEIIKLSQTDGLKIVEKVD